MFLAPRLEPPPPPHGFPARSGEEPPDPAIPTGAKLEHNGGGAPLNYNYNNPYDVKK